MSHVDDGQLNALLDGELTADEARDVQAHVAGCAECARRLAEARVFLAESGELLSVLSPAAPVAASPVVPPAAAAPPVTRAEDAVFVAPLARGPGASGSLRKSGDSVGEPAVAKTSKEIAVSIEGRTARTPAIRPVTRPEVPVVRAKPDWRLPDLEKLAWAASLLLCLGVGYLANEVYHLRRQHDAPAVALRRDASPTQVATAPRAGTSKSEVARERTGGGFAAHQPTVPSRSSGRLAAAPGLRAGDLPAGVSGGRVAKPGGPVSKPAPTITQRPADQIASAAPARGASGAGAALADRADRRDEPSTVSPATVPAPAPSASAAASELRGRNAQAPAGPGMPSRAIAATAPRAANSLEEASADAGGAALTAFRRITIDEAVRRLSGTIRLIEDMQASRVEVGPGHLVPGADPERNVVRVTYTDPHGSRFVLEEQIGDVRTGSFNGLMQGDTLVTTTDAGATRVRWVDRKFWLSITGPAAPDSLRALVMRVR